MTPKTSTDSTSKTPLSVSTLEPEQQVPISSSDKTPLLVSPQEPEIPPVEKIPSPLIQNEPVVEQPAIVEEKKEPTPPKEVSPEPQIEAKKSPTPQVEPMEVDLAEELPKNDDIVIDKSKVATQESGGYFIIM